ncbi:MAG: hypothetical protein WBB64_13125, partial [Anaerolineales bacterium]
MSLGHGAYQRFAVSQTLTTGPDMAEEALMALGTVLPHDLIRDISLLFVRVLVLGLPLRVACIRRIDIV